MVVTLMSITGYEITVDHVEGLIDKYKGTAYSLRKKFVQMERDFKFVWPPYDIGTFNYNTAEIASDPVSSELVAKLKMSVTNLHNTEDAILTSDEIDVIHILENMGTYTSDSEKSSSGSIDFSSEIYRHDSKKRYFDKIVYEFGGERSAFSPYKK